MAFRIAGVVRIADNGDANLGIVSASLLDGKVSSKAITEQDEGDSSDVTGADELLLYDNDTGDLLRVTVDDFITGAGIGTILTDFNNIDVSGIATLGSTVNLGGSIIPDTNLAYDLGSATNRFKDLYLSGNTIYLGDSQVSSDNLVLRNSSGVIEPDGVNSSGIITGSKFVGDGSLLTGLDAGATGATGPIGASGPEGPQGATGPAPESTGGFFVVPAERNGSPNSNQYFAFGNGGSTLNEFTVPEDCELAKLCVKSQTNYNGGGNFEIVVVKNGAEVSSAVLSVPADNTTNSGVATFDTPVSVLAIDPDNGNKPTDIAFKCKTGGKGGGVTVVSGYFVTSGARGATGIQGPPGPEGGATGATGATGLQGPQGEIGPVGPPSTQPGPAGPLGSTGATGPKGDVGNPGPAGPVGTKILGTVANEAALPSSGTLGEGYVVTSPNTEPANSVFVWNGIVYTSIGPVQGPQGERGATGPKGDPGQNGQDGSPGTPGSFSTYLKCTLRENNQINNTPLATTNTGINEANFRERPVIETSGATNSGGWTFSIPDAASPTEARAIIFPETGIYMLSISVYLRSTGTRTNTGMKVAIGPSGSQVLQPETAAMAYVRQSNQTSTSLTFSGIYSAGAGDELSIWFSRMGVAGGTSVVSVGEASAISIVKVS